MDNRHPDSFGARDTLGVGGRELEIFRLDALQERFDVARLPFSLKILLENLLRTEDGQAVTREDIEALAGWDPSGPASIEIAFTPSRVLMQDFTGVPAIVDLAAMRDAMEALRRSRDVLDRARAALSQPQPTVFGRRRPARVAPARRLEPTDSVQRMARQWAPSRACSADPKSRRRRADAQVDRRCGRSAGVGPHVSRIWAPV